MNSFVGRISTRSFSTRNKKNNNTNWNEEKTQKYVRFDALLINKCCVKRSSSVIHVAFVRVLGCAHTWTMSASCRCGNSGSNVQCVLSAKEMTSDIVRAFCMCAYVQPRNHFDCRFFENIAIASFVQCMGVRVCVRGFLLLFCFAFALGRTSFPSKGRCNAVRSLAIFFLFVWDLCFLPSLNASFAVSA